MIDIQFGKLFTIELLHKYYSNFLCNDFHIVPSEATLPKLGGYRIVVKQYGNSLYAGIQQASASSPPITGSPPAGSPPAGVLPFITPNASVQLTFFMQLQNSLFLNYTSMPNSYPASKLYYYTNRNNNPANGKNFLSSPIAVYNATITYSPGQLTNDGTGKIFECIKTCKAIPPSAANSQNWMQIDSNQFNTEQDALLWMPAVSTYMFTSPQNSVTVTVSGYNVSVGNYSSVVLNSTISFTTPSAFFTLDFSGLSPGKYYLQIKGSSLPIYSQWIYLNDELNGTDVFGIIDIFNDASLGSNYQLLTSSGTLNAPLYSIFFVNRSSIWKYILASGVAGQIADTANIYQFSTPASSTIYSLTPIPLQDSPQDFTLTIGTNPPHNRIPCASPQRLVNYQPSPPTGDIYACSEIYLNY